MNNLEIDSLKLDDAEIVPKGDGIKVRGVLSMRSPSEVLTPYFKELHARVSEIAPSRFSVDIQDLSFMNSSSIRVFLDWVEWIRTEPPNRQYVISFLHDPGVTWQSTTLAVIRSLDQEHVQLRTI